jgi:hypothetical protein
MPYIPNRFLFFLRLGYYYYFNAFNLNLNHFMKQFYLRFLFVIATVLSLTSCNPKYRFVTKGLREKDSSYVINSKGERINAAEVVVRRKTLTVDGKEMSLGGLSAIKSKKMYFAVSDGKLYFGEVYGKINMLYEVKYDVMYTNNGFAGGNSYAGGGYGLHGGSYQTTARKVYYLQKQGSANIDKLNRAVLMDYVADNEDALRTAKASYAWKYGSYIPALGFVTGVVWAATKAVNNKDNSGSASLGAPLALAGISLPLYLISGNLANHKLKKAIYIYNGLK